MDVRDNTYLGIAVALAAAAYLLTTRDANAADDANDASNNSVSGNGFAINNPLNIRYLASNAFNGQTGNHNGYGVYDTLAHGVRAASHELQSYISAGYATVTAIISRWAPSTENDTAAYIADVAGRMNVDANEPIIWGADGVPLIQAMAYHENGYNNMADSDVATWAAS